MLSTTRCSLGDIGVVHGLLTAEESDGERLVLLIGEMPGEEFYATTVEMNGRRRRTWLLEEKPRHVFRHGHGIFSWYGLHGPGHRVFRLDGEPIQAAPIININALSNNAYHPGLAAVYAL